MQEAPIILLSLHFVKANELWNQVLVRFPATFVNLRKLALLSLSFLTCEMGRGSTSLGMQPGALPFPQKELSPREALAVCQNQILVLTIIFFFLSLLF